MSDKPDRLSDADRFEVAMYRERIGHLQAQMELIRRDLAAANTKGAEVLMRISATYALGDRDMWALDTGVITRADE